MSKLEIVREPLSENAISSWASCRHWPFNGTLKLVHRIGMVFYKHRIINYKLLNDNWDHRQVRELFFQDRSKVLVRIVTFRGMLPLEILLYNKVDNGWGQILQESATFHFRFDRSIANASDLLSTRATSKNRNSSASFTRSDKIWPPDSFHRATESNRLSNGLFSIWYQPKQKTRTHTLSWEL